MGRNKYIEYSKKKNIKIGFLTNVVLLDREKRLEWDWYVQSFMRKLESKNLKGVIYEIRI